MTQENINIAKLLYEAYPHSDLLPIDPGWDCCDLGALLERVTTHDIGDGLFRFMVVEIVEGGESTLTGAIRVMARARDDVQAVLDALRTAQNPRQQHLYEVRATEYNKRQEYAHTKLLTAENIVDAIQAAREYFQHWYEDEDPAECRTNDPDMFEFEGGSIRLVIRSIQQTTLAEWVRGQLQLHGIGQLPEEWMMFPLGGSATELVEACKTLISYTSDLLYRLDNQVNLDEIEEIQQAKAAIAHYESSHNSAAQRAAMTLKELSSEHSPVEIPVHLLCEHGKLWIRPNSYGDASSSDGHGFPVALEIWRGRLRLVVFDDINSEDPKIIDLENAKESCRIEDSQEDSNRYRAAAEYVSEQGRSIFTGHMIGGLWNARTLDACIMSGKEGNKAAYKFLVRFGDQYAQQLPESRKQQWQKIKDYAAGLLKSADADEAPNIQ